MEDATQVFHDKSRFKAKSNLPLKLWLTALGDLQLPQWVTMFLTLTMNDLAVGYYV